MGRHISRCLFGLALAVCLVAPVSAGCETKPCKNGGTCITRDIQDVDHLSGTYMCNCAFGFRGIHSCEIESTCSEAQQTCSNRGTCSRRPSHEVEDLGPFKCTCRFGYTGDVCEKTDICETNPCENGGTCIAREAEDVDAISGAYLCSCVWGYRGKNCHIEMTCSGAGHVCANGGTCRRRPSHEVKGQGPFQCTCSQGYTGDLCQNVENSVIRDTCQRKHLDGKTASCSQLDGTKLCIQNLTTDESLVWAIDIARAVLKCE